jgi:hypothetical protein
VADRIPEDDDERLELIGELQSVSAALRVPLAGTAEHASAEIPVLLDIVELPRPAHGASAPAAGATPAGEDARAALEFEAASLVDDLIDEFLPLAEARLRERLEERLQLLLAAESGAAAQD